MLQMATDVSPPTTEWAILSQLTGNSAEGADLERNPSLLLDQTGYVQNVMLRIIMSNIYRAFYCLKNIFPHIILAVSTILPLKGKIQGQSQGQNFLAKRKASTMM